MTSIPVSATRDAAELFASAEQPQIIPDARRLIREANAEAGTWVIVLDDDPTGSQAVHGVPVLTRWQRDDLLWAFDQPGGVFFILTNTRGLNPGEATGVLTEIAESIAAVTRESGASYEFITRGDSTLRGHYPLETDVLAEMAMAQGEPYDALLIAPAYLPAGRITSGDSHWVRTGDRFTPVAETDYARDATFGFASSDLKLYVEEKTSGRISASTVLSIGLDDIRLGGPDRVCEIILSARDATPIVVNATVEADLDVAVLGLTMAEARGARVLCRTGPSFVAARIGLEPRAPLTHDDIFAAGEREGNGLVVVGSHVELTTAQVDHLLAVIPDIAVIELDVTALLDDERRAGELNRCGRELVSALRAGDALLMTSRRQVVGDSGHSSLVIAQTVSAALVGLTALAVDSVPLGWVMAKGGITSSDTATGGLGIRRAIVVGQLFPGIVSVWVNEGDDDSGLRGLPYIVFAGNVGEATTLADAVTIMRGDRLYDTAA
jgi:uncharacterized protein YgbK (DUF1537 family)